MTSSKQEDTKIKGDGEMANTYNPYSDIKSIYDLKGQWDEANKAGDTGKKNQVAASAQAYYDKLKNNGYSGVAQALSASGYQDAKKILDSYSPTTTAPDSTTLSNPELITTNNNETRNKINQLWGTQTSDRETMSNKYNKLEDTAYSNPFETDEAKAILAKYDLSGLQARNNAVASGSASNGGNIDSYAAANAMRQQASLVNQGQMTVLEAHNNKINNVKGILESLGVYQQNQDKGMQTTIGLQSNEGQRLFENEETAKNNETARLVEQANVTGYTPSEWTIKNDDVYKTYLNEDGTFKKEMENVDIQALINSAKASGDTETAKKLAVVRAKKMLGNWKDFGQYAGTGDISYMSPQITEARRESEQNNATALKTLGMETDLANKELEIKKAISDSTLANEIEKIDAETDANIKLMEKQQELSGGSTKLTEEQIKSVETFAQYVNNAFKNNKNNPDGIALIEHEGRGSFKLNIPAGTQKSWWRDPVMYKIMDSDSLTDAEQSALIESLGWGEKDILEMYEKYPELDK